MTRDITTYFSDDRNDDAGSVNLDHRGLSITNSDGSSLHLGWGEWDRLVAEVNKLRPLAQEAA